AVCARFAEQVGLVWAGGMALGAGEGVIHQTPLTKLGRQARLPRQALEIAAKALATGQSIPQAAIDLMAKPSIPPWLYLLIGGLSWRYMAKPYGTQKHLRRAPYQKLEA
ncbi:MAG: NAD(P)H dehydrogenase, partial [Oscillochloris sp.]|nr:NAD(P)H dehydrogenase [Oscillochloris sp.]